MFNGYQYKILSVTLDPKETAKDMTDRYKTECYNIKVRPIAKLLEQLEVSPNLHMLPAKFHLMRLSVFTAVG